MRVLFLGLLVTSFAFSKPVLNTDGWSREFLLEKETFSGDMHRVHTWEGFLCNGEFTYGGKTGGTMKNIQFKVKDGYLEVMADARDIWLRLNGTYRSEASYCFTVRPWIGMNADWGTVVAKIYLNEDSETNPIDKIVITESEFGRMHFGSLVPEYVEDVVTGFTNQGFAEVWANNIGDWLNKKITDQVKKADALKGIGGSSL
ncbi:MAG: hypothetical protein HYR96_07945 [Deltaproteobacteria bacterium]|nr:hypothetical protein [Deltaproteobacteria bacterium]MBI3293439.1 hypothetical protein [Deltaproteobacteria bacterium]